jgi:hypothetical protein
MGNLESGRFRGVMLALALVPSFFFMEHVGPAGFPTAQGCSGSGATGIGGGSSGATAPQPRVTIERDLSAEKPAVATDGFFLLRLEQVSDDKDISVVVTDEADVPIAGSVKTWRLGLTDGKVYGPTDEVGLQRVDTYRGWEAEQPLKVGSKIKAKVGLKSSGATMDSLELEVVGEPTALTAAQGLAFNEWLTFGHGVGNQVTCQAPGGACGPHEFMVPSTEESLAATRPTWAGPGKVNGTLLWSAKLEVSADDQLFTSFPVALDDTGLRVLSAPPPQPIRLGMVVFPKDAKKLCATLVLHDLRSDKEVKAEHCEDSAGKSTSTVRDFALAVCTAPPSPALAQAWCELHPESKLPACTGIMDPVDPVDPVPNEGVAGGPTNAGDGATTPPVKMPTNAAQDSEHTSSGCSVGLARTTGGGLAFALGFVAAAVAFTRRRRNR